MIRGARARGSLRIWRLLLAAQFREQPWRLTVTVLAIALGVALGAAVYLVNIAALNEFGLATKRLVGEADVVVRGPRDGFPESLYPTLAADPQVKVASPVLELEVALPGRRADSSPLASACSTARPSSPAAARLRRVRPTTSAFYSRAAGAAPLARPAVARAVPAPGPA